MRIGTWRRQAFVAVLAAFFTGCSQDIDVIASDPSPVPPSQRLRGTLQVYVGEPILDIVAERSPWTLNVKLGTGVETSLPRVLGGAAEVVKVEAAKRPLADPTFDGYDRAVMIDNVVGFASWTPIPFTPDLWKVDITLTGRVLVKGKPPEELILKGRGEKVGTIGPASSIALTNVCDQLVARLTGIPVPARDK